MVHHPAEYPRSSYPTYAQGELSKLLTPHALYTSLAAENKTREAAYRELFRYQLDPGLIDEIRTATNGNYAVGSQHFQAQISAAVDRRVAPGRPGRPRKK